MSLMLSFVCGVFLGMVPVQVVQDGVGFTAVWERNVEQSDDPQQKMQEAMAQMREQMGRRGGGGGGGGGGGRSPGGRGGGGRGGGRGGRGEGGGRPDLGNVFDELTLKREMADGTKLETVAELKGNAVFIEEKMERGKLDRKFELSPDGGTMIVTLTVKFGRMKDPVIIKTVYERASEISD